MPEGALVPPYPFTWKWERFDQFHRAETWKCTGCGYRLNTPEATRPQNPCPDVTQHRFPMTTITDVKQAQIEQAMGDVLELLGAPVEDPNFQGTPARFIRYLTTHFQIDTARILDELRASVFPSSYTGMVVETGIKVAGICPHHLLPVRYRISVGYLVAGKALGLSKLVRLARAIAAKPVLQEDATEQVAVELEKLVQTPGVGVVVQGQHSCMSHRGVRAAPKVTTSTVRGVLRENASAKEEFLMLAGLR